MPSLFTLAALGLVMVAVRSAFRWHSRELSGAAHYSRHPGAKLLDDGVKQGAIRGAKLGEVIDRLAAAESIQAEIAVVRDEKDIK